MIMKPITSSEVREIQFEMLKDIADFCECTAITYFLAYGTLIGAVRHNGFIPWDDDIDIAMPRPDYDRFIKLYNNKISNYRVIDSSIDKNYLISYAKVYDERTWLNEIKYKDDKLGIFIDIFPIDGYNGKIQMCKAKILDKVLHAKRANFKKRSVLKNLVNGVVKIILSPFSVCSLIKFSDMNARQKEFGSTPKAANFLETYGSCEVLETSIFENTFFHKFEGGEFRIPIGYDRWLRSIYGDYMQLPPKEQQVARHSYIAYWKDR